MKTPDPITAEQAGEAVARILDRRRQIDDPHIDEFIVAAHDARELLKVVLKRRRGIPDWVAAADVHDALVLHVRRWWEWVEDDHALLERAEQLTMNRREVGDVLNLGSGQAIVDRIKARRGQLARLSGEPDPGELATTASENDHAELQQRWLDTHRGQVRAIAKTFIEHRHLATDDADEWLVEVARDYREEACTPAGMTLLGYAAAELTQCPAVRVLADDHPLQAALEDWGKLVEQYRISTEQHGVGQ